MIVTDDDELALKCRLIANHAESVVNDMWNESKERLLGRIFGRDMLVGFNIRMTELQAAIISVQLDKFDSLLEQRMENVNHLIVDLDNIPAINCNLVRQDCTHTYYVLPFQWSQEVGEGLHRDVFIRAVKAELTPRLDRDGEGVQIGCGYIKPIPLMPLFGMGKGICPVCEYLWSERLFLTLLHAPNSTTQDMKDVSNAFFKVWEHKKELNGIY